MKLNFITRWVVASFTIVGVIAAIGQLTFANVNHQKINSNTDTNLAEITTQEERSVEEIARLITVRIFANSGAGSGVIINHQGQTYTVLTGQHVVNPSPDGRLKVMTPDGETYPAFRKQLVTLQGVDLAVVQFESQKPYQVAVFGNPINIYPDEPVYTSGFPNYHHNHGSNSIESTLDWGLKAFQVTKGTLSMLLSDQSLIMGYQLGYTNSTAGGMSGGPVLDQQGRLIGIHGRGKHPLSGIDAFRLSDGTKPSQKLFERMNALSWAIPITTFQQKIDQLPDAE